MILASVTVLPVARTPSSTSRRNATASCPLPERYLTVSISSESLLLLIVRFTARTMPASSSSPLDSSPDRSVSSLESCWLGVCRLSPVWSPSLSDNVFVCVRKGVPLRVAPRAACAVVTFPVLTSESEPVCDQKSRHLCNANDPASSLDQMQPGWRETVDRFATFWSVHKYLSLSAR